MEGETAFWPKPESEQNQRRMNGRIVFATGNAGKVKEIQMIMADMDMEVVSMKEAGIVIEIEENGRTYEENAMLKARAVAAHTHDIVMADDSGLEIDYLHQEPGIYSARYMGEDTPYSVKNANLIERLSGVPDEQRTARFVCAIAAVMPDGTELTTRATIEGRIGIESGKARHDWPRTEVSTIRKNHGRADRGGEKSSQPPRKSTAAYERGNEKV